MIIEIRGYGKAVFLEEKLTQYALNPLKDRHKAAAFRLALGYQIQDADELMRNVAAHINNYTAVEKPDNGYGKRFQILMELTGKNGKTAKVMTAWIQDQETKVIRLTSIYVKECDIMDIKLYDKVRLKTGETASIVEIYEIGVAYEADIDRMDGSIDTDTIRQEDILAIVTESAA